MSAAPTHPEQGWQGGGEVTLSLAGLRRCPSRTALRAGQGARQTGGEGGRVQGTGGRVLSSEAKDGPTRSGCRRRDRQSPGPGVPGG